MARILQSQARRSRKFVPVQKPKRQLTGPEHFGNLILHHLVWETTPQ